ncbi:MAG: sigma-70 family RNA polymerase sigma factor [Planctomycetes bacterium]|nr:sigma-70 family RNA polymerase sigma factor [Planctomycetota bacterium]
MPRVQLATQGSTSADAGAFVREHQTAVWRYLRLLGADPATADDLLQETFLRFLRRPGPHPDSGAILRTIARGLWIDRHRWLQRRRVVQWAEHVDEALARAVDPDQDLWLDALHACRDKLAARARCALDLAYRDGLGRQQVADQLGLSPNTVRNLLAQTREVLRQCIEKRVRECEGGA